MNDRRKFIRWALAAAVMPGAIPKRLDLQPLHNYASPQDDLTNDEDFWGLVRQAYTVNPNLINLNNGGVAPQPKVVQDAVEHFNRVSNETPSFYMWRILDQGREPVRTKLAAMAGCSAEEIAINRNASEALETIIFGLRLKAGDEVILTKQDYPNMINAWKQRAHRDGVVLKWINLELPNENKADIVRLFSDQITSRTKVLHLTHMINWTGQILPVKELAALARQHNLETVVDAAHTFAHFPYNISDLGLDYLGTSLHKWLSAPFGSGMLYVRQPKIKNLYPLLAAGEPESSDIRKFENLGTRSFAIEQGIGNAIEFQHLIGSERKAQRLHFLKNYWVQKALNIPGFKIHTSLHRDYACGLSNFSIQGIDPGVIGEKLFNQYKIHCVPIIWENISGVRITPNTYTTLRELDTLVEAIHKIAREKT